MILSIEHRNAVIARVLKERQKTFRYSPHMRKKFLSDAKRRFAYSLDHADFPTELEKFMRWFEKQEFGI